MSDATEYDISESLEYSHATLCITPIEEQLKDIPPSTNLVEFYRKKLASYEKEFTLMNEKVYTCQRSCDGDSENLAALSRCSDQVLTLQKALSDVQVYLQHERNQVISLNSEIDRLKIQIAKDKKTISYLLLHSGNTEDQVAHLINEGKSECLGKTPAIQTKEGFRLSLTNEKDVGGQKDPEMLAQRINSLEAQLNGLTIASQDEIYTLHQDRQCLLLEKEKGSQKLQDQVLVLSKRLNSANMNICELTSELIALKKDFIKKEEKWVLEKERGQNKHSCEGVDETPKTCECKSQFQKANMLKVLKDQLQQKDRLIRKYKEQCTTLESELWKLKESKDKSTQVLEAQVQKVTQQLANMKNKCQKLHQKRCFEAEGFRSDVRILKGQLNDMKRKLARNNEREIRELQEQVDLSWETRIAAQRLEHEMVQIYNLMFGANEKVLKF